MRTQKEKLIDAIRGVFYIHEKIEIVIPDDEDYIEYCLTHFQFYHLQLPFIYQMDDWELRLHLQKDENFIKMVTDAQIEEALDELVKSGDYKQNYE